MLNEETFPSDFENFDDDLSLSENGDPNKNINSNETVYSRFYDSQASSTNNIDSLIEKPARNPYYGGKNENSIGTSFSSIESSFGSKRLPSLPPRAPMKKKRYQSCQDLFKGQSNYRSNKTYVHVESKVKKFIDTNGVKDRKTLTRHKSMPESTQILQLREDDPFKDEVDINILKKELYRRSDQIKDLEDTIQSTSNKVYALEYEKTQMSMKIDTIRLELHALKEKEMKEKSRLSSNSFANLSHRSFRSSRDIDVQTDCSDLNSTRSMTAIIDTEMSYHFAHKPKINIYKDSSDEVKKKRVTINEFAGKHFENPLSRELSYNVTAEDMNSISLHNGSSMSTNLSTDDLLPLADNSNCHPSDDFEHQSKKKKKLKYRLIKLMIPCVSSNKK